MVVFISGSFLVLIDFDKFIPWYSFFKYFLKFSIPSKQFTYLSPILFINVLFENSTITEKFFNIFLKDSRNFEKLVYVDT